MSGVRAEVYFAPGSAVTFRMPRKDHEVFAAEAAQGVIGQCPPLTQPDGTRHHSEVIAAWVKGADLFVTLRVGEPEPPGASADR